MYSIVQEKPQENKVFVKNGNEYYYSTYMTRCLLKMIGTWPLDGNVSTFERISHQFIKVLYCCILLFFFLPTLQYVIFISKGLRSRTRICAMLFTNFTNFFKYILLMKYNNEIKLCLWQTKEDWKNILLQQDYESMISRGKLGRYWTLFSILLTYIGIFMNRMILPLVKGKRIVNNVTIRPLPCPTYFRIFDEQKSPAYEIVFFNHVLSAYIIYTISATVFALTIYFILHACGQLEILIRKMRDIETMNLDVGNADELILEAILHQAKTRSFIKKVAEIVQYMCLAEVAGCVFCICISLHSLAMEINSMISIVTHTIIMVTFTYNLFILCYIGELLADQNLKVHLMSRTLDWHNLPLKSVRNLLLVILASNDAPKLVAGKVMDLTLSNFTSVFKSAVGYFNILRSSTL
uniref:odorant receptor 82a-like n=1 Tax=Vespula vulgaris TaxID=7454 RepID=UPI00223B98FF|nr:odorant receptor 82a-like [Vespula vulgaris]